MTTPSNKAMNELNEPIRKLGKTFTRRESRHQSRANPCLKASVFVMGLMMVVFFMGFDWVSNAQAQEVEETKPQSKDGNQPKDVLLIPLQQVMGALGALKQQEYHDARATLIEKCRHQDEATPECMNTCQQVKKVEKVWDAVVVKTCKCYTSPNSSFACQITCKKMCNCDKPQAEWYPSASCQTLCSNKEAEKKEVQEGINTVNKNTGELFCSEVSETELRLNGLVFSTYLLWDMSKAVEEIATLTQNANEAVEEVAALTQTMNMMANEMMTAGKAELGVVLSLAQNEYLKARTCANPKDYWGRKRDYCMSKEMWDKLEYCNTPPINPACQQDVVLRNAIYCRSHPNDVLKCQSPYARFVDDVNKVITAVVCQEYPKTPGCPQPGVVCQKDKCPQPDIGALIKECQDKSQCKINIPRVFSTFLLWEMIEGINLAVDGLNNLNTGNGIHTALGKLKNMVEVMVLMNRNMEMMRHDMGIMRHDMDSTMGRAGRAMPPWMPWGW